MIDFDGDFRVNLYRKRNIETETTQATQGTIRAGLSEEDKAVLESLVEDSNITQKEIAAKLGWKIDRVKYYINKMKRKGIIKRVGTSQNGYWEVWVDKKMRC